MFDSSKRALFWAPRALSIVFIAFLGLFAMDVFDQHLGFWQTARALTIHLTPSFVLMAALILAWRPEGLGAALYPGAALLYVIWVVFMPSHLPATARLTWALSIAGPAFLIAGLFLANWLKHGELRIKQR